MSMPPFSFDMISPFPSGCTGTNGGPHMGGHKDRDPKNWFNIFGMDFSAPVGTRVYSAFTATVTKHRAHVKANDKEFDYGAQIAARASNKLMGVFYEHVTNVPASIIPGATINQGDFLGEVYIIPKSGMPEHLHWALVEFIGGRAVGVDLFKSLFAMRNTSAAKSFTFFQEESKPPIETPSP